MYYTQYKGMRCALPLLADVYGFYYNKALFKKAGLTRPPQDVRRAHRLREEAHDTQERRVARRRRLRPRVRLLPERDGGVSAARRREVLRRRRASPRSRRIRAGRRCLNWQKGLIDYYGYDKLVKWQAGAGDEFSASHAFERGKLAMMLDGEWRVAFIAAEHPDLEYGTAPMPVDDAKPSLYGSGYINGTIIGIPKAGKNRDEAWKLVKYLTTNDHALATVLERDPQRAVDAGARRSRRS